VTITRSFRSALDQPPADAEQEVDVQVAFVGLVEDQRVVALEQRIVLELAQQQAVGHQLDQRARAGAIDEAHLVADEVARRGAELGTHPVRERRAAMRRGCVWPISPATPRPSSRQIFGSCVLLPLPVAPLTIVTGERAMAAAISARRACTGRLSS